MYWFYHYSNPLSSVYADEEMKKSCQSLFILILALFFHFCVLSSFLFFFCLLSIFFYNFLFVIFILFASFCFHFSFPHFFFFFGSRVDSFRTRYTCFIRYHYQITQTFYEIYILWKSKLLQIISTFTFLLGKVNLAFSITVTHNSCSYMSIYIYLKKHRYTCLQLNRKNTREYLVK